MDTTTDDIQLTTELQQLITAEQAWHYHIIPKSKTNDRITFIADQSQWQPLWQDELEMIFGKTIEVELQENRLVNLALGKFYRKGKSRGNLALDRLNAESEDFIFQLIAEADNVGSSDIHLERYEDRCRIRLRIDGKMMERYVIPNEDYPSIINKLKIKANLDIAEKRLPQDGRISFQQGKQKFDIRVSVLPTLHGEKVVMRLLSKDATDINIEQLGFQSKQLTHYLEGVKKSHGIVLISGPTGSGKTTTLYATLKELNDDKTNILTIEDPIEYTLDGINQVQLRENIGLNFSAALRSFLRQDPDVIMLGEIRDAETAQMAIRAALTGHLVLSTIHTNSAWGTISRLIDMGVPPYLLAGTINVTAAQRLVRLLCENCKQSQPFEEKLLPSGYRVPKSIHTHAVAVGCDSCHYTGYSGRKAIYEIIPIDLEMAELIKNNKFNIKEELNAKKIKTLMDSAFELLFEEKTSVEEVYSILMSSN